MDQGTERAVVYLVMDAVAGARRTPGRHETGGVPPKSPATTLLSLWPSAFWDFGSLYQRRRGVIFFLRAVAAAVSSSLSLRRLWLRVAAQASRTSHSRCFCSSDVEASFLTSCCGRRVQFSRRRCGVTVCLQLRRSYLVLPWFLLRE